MEQCLVMFIIIIIPIPKGSLVDVRKSQFFRAIALRSIFGEFTGEFGYAYDIVIF